MHDCYALAKREMFDDQTSLNIVWWSNILMFEALAKRFKHVFFKHRQTSERKELWAAELPRVPQLPRTKLQDGKLFFLFFINAVHNNLVPEYFASIF